MQIPGTQKDSGSPSFKPTNSIVRMWCRWFWYMRLPNNALKDTASENVSSRILSCKQRHRLLNPQNDNGKVTNYQEGQRNWAWRLHTQQPDPKSHSSTGLLPVTDGRGSQRLPSPTPDAVWETTCGGATCFFMSLVSISKYEMEVPDWQNLGHTPAARLQRWLKTQISSTSHFHRRQSGMCQVRKGRFRAGRPKTMVSIQKNQTFPQWASRRIKCLIQYILNTRIY